MPMPLQALQKPESPDNDLILIIKLWWSPSVTLNLQPWTQSQRLIVWLIGQINARQPCWNTLTIIVHIWIIFFLHRVRWVDILTGINTFGNPIFMNWETHLHTSYIHVIKVIIGSAQCPAQGIFSKKDDQNITFPNVMTRAIWYST